jgi:preprotein translocase subunit YajC
VTSRELRNLEPGDRVVFLSGSVEGTVRSTGAAGVEVVWDDGEEGWIAADDADYISKIAGRRPEAVPS